LTIDPFGGFDLLFSNAEMNLKIIEVPLGYQKRIYRPVLASVA
jgi:hypothetical protein